MTNSAEHVAMRDAPIWRERNEEQTDTLASLFRNPRLGVE